MLLVVAAFLATTDPSTAELDYNNAYLEKAGLPPMSAADLAARKARDAISAATYAAGRRLEFGLEPPEALQKAGRSLIRASYTEPRLFVRMPGITLERNKGGRSFVRLSSTLWSKTSTKPISAADLGELKALEAAAFAPDPSPPWTNWKKGDPLPDPPAGVCHGWGVTLERISPAEALLREGHGCNRGEEVQARLQYGEKLAQVALAAFPGCAPFSLSTSTFYRLSDCLKKLRPGTRQTP